jgi:putative FmdB family regulatory protein
MPIYTFHCNTCGKDYEYFRTLEQAKEEGECIVCGSSEIDRRERLLEECGCGCGCEPDPCDCC